MNSAPPPSTDERDDLGSLHQSFIEIKQQDVSHNALPIDFDEFAFKILLNNTTHFERSTVDKRHLTYVLNIKQQPERGRASGTGAGGKDRRPIDPPPVVSLRIFERRNSRQVDVTFSYKATFLLFATLEAAPSHTNKISYEGQPAVTQLWGSSVSNGIYLHLPTQAIYFVFPDLSVGYAGNYRLSMNLYERADDPEYEDTALDDFGTDIMREQAPSGVATPRDDLVWRVQVKSSMFTVFNAKEFPGLTESTVLTRALGDQGVRLRFRQDSRTLLRRLSIDTRPSGEVDSWNVFDIEQEEFDYGDDTELDYEDDTGASLWNDSAYASRKDSMSSTGTFRDRRPTPPVEDHPAHISNLLAEGQTGLTKAPSSFPPLAHVLEFSAATEKSLSRNPPDATSSHASILDPDTNTDYKYIKVRESIKFPVHDPKTIVSLPSSTNHDLARGKASKLKAGEGCVTCKIRKLKCGEERPTCHRCVRAGCQCGGYDEAALLPTTLKESRLSMFPNKQPLLPPSTPPETSSMLRDVKPQSRALLQTIAEPAKSIQTEKKNLTIYLMSLDARAINIAFDMIFPFSMRHEFVDYDPADLRASDALLFDATADGETRSHVVKRASQEWWLAHPLERWEAILPKKASGTHYARIRQAILSSWHGDLIGSNHDAHDYHNGWFDYGPFLDHDAEVKMVEQLVEDVFRRLNITSDRIRQFQPGYSVSSQSTPSDSIGAVSTSSQSARLAPKRRSGYDTQEQGGYNDDERKRDDRSKRRKKNADEYSRYLICTEFAAGEDPACPNCFFGAWPSVDRLKQDHLIKIHKFDPSLLKIDKGGTESDKWWKVFNKLHPGFREANPSTFIPGPLWEDRLAHNAYNKILAKAMREAERIRQRSNQNLSSLFQDLLDQQQNSERQELRQMVLNLMSSSTGSTGIVNLLTPEPETDTQSENPQSDASSGIEISMAPSHPSDVSFSEPSTLGILGRQFFTPTTSFSASEPLPSTYLPALDEHRISTQSIENIMDNSIFPLDPNVLEIQDTRSTAALSATPQLSGASSSPENGLIAWGKVCRCRVHSSRCTRSIRVDMNEFCVGCSGWFSWSAMAEPFLRH